MEDFKDYLRNKEQSLPLNNSFNKLYNIKNIDQISDKNVCTDRDFNDYESFYSFVIKHYDLKHLQECNYIKYVKIMRHLNILKYNDVYTKKIKDMNLILLKLSENNIVSYSDITKFFYKVDSISKILNERKQIIKLTIKNIRYIINDNNSSDKLKLLFSINNLIYKLAILEKYSKKLEYLIKDYIDWENELGIDHDLIKANNHKRTYLGLRSESYTNKIVMSYINNCNKICKSKKNNIIYFYEKNINIIKLFNIEAFGRKKIKGEIDGLIISYDGIIYKIEYIIEVKSSIKATFEDIGKIIFFKEFISKYSWDNDIIYENYIFTKESFNKILNLELYEWCIYFCIINDERCLVEKSNIYFYTVLKILDNNFIQKYYIENDENIIKDKYKIITNNMVYINKLFDEWKSNIAFNTDQCNVFVFTPLQIMMEI